VKEYKIRIARQAREHLNGIADYIAFELKSPEAARNTIVKIRREIKSLSYMPEMAVIYVACNQKARLKDMDM
jgi:plasmid stabilization system protein ParE